MKPSAIAIVGMAGRFPGARNIRDFWQNLRNGVESIRSLSDEELVAAGVSAEEMASPEYVKRASILDDVPMFDASFFGFSPRDASIMDPQHRHFLECAWEALEDAAHPPQRFNGSIGIFAGSGMNTYLIHNLLANRKLLETAGLFQLKQTGNDKDVLATRVSYQLDLRGPSINVQTACSTSLVATHLACQSLLNFECDMALAGGVTIEIPHAQGYIYREGEILSRDGRCRSFDAASSGTVFGSGLGIVVLRRLEDAIEDHDNIRAIVLGSAINNDGARKVGYLAPSVEGQAEVITEALDFAGVSAADIAYVETHGTGTIVGDPIEVRALTQAFRNSTDRVGYCGIGSLKTNIGHLDAAAGVSGLIKAVLAIENAQLPPSLHFENPNPHLDLKTSPFYVNSKLTGWPSTASPRRAGITSLGIGGTNAHLILEEAPQAEIARQPEPYQLLTVSAKTSTAADRALANLTAHLAASPELNLADVAFTCHVGRQAFPHRRALVVEDSPAALAALASEERKQIASGAAQKTAPRIVFMFSGQGAQYVDMGRKLYEHKPVFREALDLCAQHLSEPLGLDLRQQLYPAEADRQAASEKLNQTWLTQPALFAVEYALARWWMSMGIEPAAMVGHSIGEYVAACLAGVFSLEDALAIAAYRGRLMYSLPAGSMLAVPLAPGEIQLTGALSLAAVNNPEMCVVSGPTPEIAAFEEALARRSVSSRRLITSHAFHSSMMDPILAEFEQRLRSITLHPPRLPYLSNVSGTWIAPQQATDPAYWAQHLRHAVRFSDNLSELFRNPDQVLVEVGPGNTLTSLARQQSGAAAKAFQSLPHPREKVTALRSALQTLGQLWTLGANVVWANLNAPASVKRVSLPSYPFEHQKFWIEADRLRPSAAPAPKPVASDNSGIELYRRTWKPVLAASSSVSPSGCWIVFRDSLGLGDQIAAKLSESKLQVVLVDQGADYKQKKRGSYEVRPGVRADYDALIADLVKNGQTPTKIVHLWSVESNSLQSSLEQTLDRSFYSLLFLTQALAEQDIANLEIAVISNHLQQVADEAVLNPARAVILGAVRVIPKELPGILCRSIDVDLESGNAAQCAAHIVSELGHAFQHFTIAIRQSDRFVESLEPFSLDAAPAQPRLVPRGVYLISGGLGGIGLVVAERLAREFNARLVLVGRSELPPDSQWESALNDPVVSGTRKQLIRKLLAIRSIAGGLLVARADVTNLPQMQSVVALARRNFGKIDGVLHAAGVLDDGPLMLKSPQSAARVLDPKVRGTLVLEEALRDEALSCFVLFSSISAILPPAGQVDYAAANAFLDAFALSRKGPVTVVNWGLWRDVGMGARASSSHPWLDRVLLDSPNTKVHAGEFSEAHNWVLSEHKLKTGKSLIPGTGHMEMVAGAFARGSMQGAIEFEDVVFLAPLMFSGNESREVRVQLEREHDHQERGAFRFSVFAIGGQEKEGEWTEHSTGIVAPCSSRPASSVDCAAIAARCTGRAIVFDESNPTRQERQFDFGPRWRSLKRVCLGTREALADIELSPRFAADLSVLRQHPALLDMATGAALYLTEDYENSGDLFLPIAYKKLSVYRPFPARFFSHIRARNESRMQAEIETFDIALFDPQGEVLAEIEGFSMRRIADPASALERNTAQRNTAVTGAEHLIEIPDRPGIPPQEGARILTRILMSKTPTAVIAVPHLPEEASTRASAVPPQPASSAAPAAEPSDRSVEGMLVSWWQDLLGVDRVGLDDDFFSLGGHSLIGVRLFAKIRKTFQVDLELARLFEARTVRQLANAIDKAQQPVRVEQKSGAHIVPIQPNGTRVPLFCVHAVGGDVLFYEQLAKALGPDQPFYAFKSPLFARPGIGETSIEELASIYVSELRAFYPHGPYVIGGASFGGLVAYEMACQMYAQGSEPALVVLFDTKVPGHEELVEAADRVSGFRTGLQREGLSYLVRKADVKRKYWSEIVERRIRSFIAHATRRAGLKLSLDQRYFLMEEAHYRALNNFIPKPYAGKLTLMRAVDRGPEVLGKREDYTLGWGPFVTGTLEIHDIETAHMFMLFEPNVESFAAFLKTFFPK